MCFHLGHLVAFSWLNLITKFSKIQKNVKISKLQKKSQQSEDEKKITFFLQTIRHFFKYIFLPKMSKNNDILLVLPIEEISL